MECDDNPDAQSRADDTSLRGWFRVKAWKQWWHKKFPSASASPYDSSFMTKQQEEEMHAIFNHVVCRTVNTFETIALPYKEMRAASWVKALQEHHDRCMAFQDSRGRSGTGDPTMKVVRRILTTARENLKEQQAARMLAIAKRDWKHRKRVVAIRKRKAAQTPKDKKPCVVEEFEMDPNLAKELKRAADFEKGPTATSSQEGIDELTAYVSKRQEETEAAASTSSDVNRSYHNEQMLVGPIPVVNHVGENCTTE